MKTTQPPPTYEFKCVDLDTFELVVNCEVVGKIMKVIINQAQKTLRAKTGQFPRQGHIEELLDKHRLPSNYHRLVHTTIKPILNEIYAEVLKDGIEILRDDTEKASYYSHNGVWNIELTIRGTYHKK